MRKLSYLIDHQWMVEYIDNKNPKRRTKKWFNEVTTFAINQAKWKSAEEYCKDQNMEFKILTEDHLFPQYK